MSSRRSGRRSGTEIDRGRPLAGSPGAFFAAWLGSAWPGLGPARHGSAWPGRSGPARLAPLGLAPLRLAWPGRSGLAWPGLAWLGLAWLGLAWLGPSLARPGPARPGLGWAGLGWAQPGSARLGGGASGQVRRPEMSVPAGSVENGGRPRAPGISATSGPSHHPARRGRGGNLGLAGDETVSAWPGWKSRLGRGRNFHTRRRAPGYLGGGSRPNLPASRVLQRGSPVTRGETRVIEHKPRRHLACQTGISRDWRGISRD
jgi:hypothetical protein